MLIYCSVLGYTTDAVPHVGRIPTSTSRFIIAGFNGHGMPQIFLTAKGLAKLILDETESLPFEATGLPAPFETSVERLQSGMNLILETVPEKEMSGVDESVGRFKRIQGAKL